MGPHAGSRVGGEATPHRKDRFDGGVPASRSPPSPPLGAGGTAIEADPTGSTLQRLRAFDLGQWMLMRLNRWVLTGTILERSRTQAEELRDLMEDERDEELKERVTEYVDDLTDNAEVVSEKLEDAQFGTFDVIWAIFRFNYSWRIFSARQIRNPHRDSFSEEADRKFEDMIDVLKLFGPVREHFKTLERREPCTRTLF